MTKQIIRVALCVAMVSMSGCATAGSSQMESTVYDTHRRVVKLDNNLEGTITKLNETTAELVARVNASDQETRRLKSVVEENRVILERLEKNLGDLTSVIYRQFNLTPPGSYAPVDVVIEPPAASTPVTVEPMDEPKEQTVAVNSTPAPTQTPVGDPSAKYAEAQRLFMDDNFTAALSSFDDYLSQHAAADPTNTANAQFWKAKCYLKLGQYREAIGEFDKVRSNYPTSAKVPFAMHNQAVAYSNLGQTSEAIALMQEVIQDYPISPAAEQAKIDLNKLRGN